MIDPREPPRKTNAGMLRSLQRQYEVPLKAAAVLAVAVFCASPVRVVSAVFHLAWTCVGIAVGVGLGLGFAMHVYEQLQGWQKAQQETQKNPRDIAAVLSVRTKGALSRTQSSALEDTSSYYALMALAGYVVDDKVLRGQVLKRNAAFWNVKYRFTDLCVDEQLGPKLLKEDWPGLPEPVTKQLGRFIEHVMRDYVSGWYSRLDGGCVFEDEREKRKRGILRDGRHKPQDTPEATIEENISSDHHSTRRRMVFSTLTHRTIPMLDQTYRVLSYAFGSLATRAEHLNLFSLALLKWTQVLAHTFKQYRHLRKVAEEKNQTDRPTEIQIIREFLLAGKLHKAVTFGLDVPSLLFADTQGVECGTGLEYSSSSDTPKDAAQVLEDRLFGTPMLKECELDYNRVVAFRLVRALLPRNDSCSNVVVALVTEIMGACVLQPLMNLWTPSFLNELIVNSMAGNHSDDGLEDGLKEAVDITVAIDKKFEMNNEDTVFLNADSERTPENGLADNLSTADKGDLLLKSKHRTSVDQRGFENWSSTASSITPGSKSTTISTENTGDLDEEIIDMKNKTEVGELLLRLSTYAVAQLKRHINLEECRFAHLNHRENVADYDDEVCQEAVLRLVMVVEAALLHGRCAYRRLRLIGDDETSRSSSEAPEETLSQLLMEMASDMAAFEKRIDQDSSASFALDLQTDLDFEPEQNEVSTIRTLISTWMHTGQLSRAIALVIKGMDSTFLPYYSKDAFLAAKRRACAFQKQMDAFDKVDIMVETMAVLASPRLDLEAEARLFPLTELGSTGEMNVEKGSKGAARARGLNEESHAPSANDLMAHNFGTASTPRFLDFHKNSAFASSLRAERERRLRSWESQKGDDSLHTVHRPGASRNEVELHNELHKLARMFYNGTNVLTIRDAAKKSDGGEEDGHNMPQTLTPDTGKVSLVTVETISSRRRIEVPDDDSSFLLRAQPRPLNPVSVHRDDRNHDLSYKCFLATYEEPAVTNLGNRSQAGRYIRRCFLQYYPIDRTATIMLHNDARKLDKRKGKPLSQEQLNQKEQPPPYLSGAFLRERHLCQKWIHRGTTAQSFMSSPIMEATDFNASPRSGRALDFVYRMSLFERPVIDLAGKRFTVHDSTARGHHRADASSLEVSDASLSALLLGLGRDAGRLEGLDRSEYRHQVEMGPDGYPMLFMKFNRQSSNDAGTEIKPYRMSFVRAALMVTSARQEAQLQCLLECVKAGSAKSATKARTDAQLKPTLKILAFANDRSNDRIRASALLRDLKLGVYHIDREQLRRNGLLNPRFPTSLRELRANVEGPVQARDVAELCGSNRVPPTSTLYKIRCVAMVELVVSEDESVELEPYVGEDGTVANEYREEWVVYRSMKDFQVLHKQLKSEVANAESSVGAGSRLVGAAAAAFSAASLGRRSRKALIPSLAQASKTGAIAVSQKAIIKRGELLSEYLEYLLSPGHIINRCTEVMLFLGASFPFPSEIQITVTPVRLVDPLGRTSFTRQVSSRGDTSKARRPNDIVGYSQTTAGVPKVTDESHQFDQNEMDATITEKPDDSDLIEAVLNKVDQVPLADVRNRLVELVKYQFGFENASFFRSRLLAALETASFVAMTKGSEFRKLLYKIHLQQLNPEAIAKLIERILDTLWPDGCWLVPRPLLTGEEEAILQNDSRKKLHEFFPEQVQAILGRELTGDGLDMVHEMLQNRLVVKSLFYMLFDLLWIEVFPELRDALPCASALDID